MTLPHLRTALFIGFIAISVVACSPEGSSPKSDQSGGQASASEQNGNATTGDADNDRSESNDEDSGSSGGGTFHGYRCTDDCSGHRAGYKWAEEHGITSPDECGGNSQSFIEGCKAYAGEEGPEEGDAEDNDDSPNNL